MGNYGYFFLHRVINHKYSLLWRPRLISRIDSNVLNIREYPDGPCHIRTKYIPLRSDTLEILGSWSFEVLNSFEKTVEKFPLLLVRKQMAGWLDMPHMFYPSNVQNVYAISNLSKDSACCGRYGCKGSFLCPLLRSRQLNSLWTATCGDLTSSQSPFDLKGESLMPIAVTLHERMPHVAVVLCVGDIEKS